MPRVPRAVSRALGGVSLLLAMSFSAPGPVAAQRIDAYAGGGVGDGTLDPYFSAPVDLAHHGSDLYIADRDVHRIRRIDYRGFAITVAGTGVGGFGGDEGPATQARLLRPGAVLFDYTVGGLLIADNGNRRLRRVGDTGVITTIAGTGVDGATGDGGAAANARLGEIADIESDPSGNIYLALPQQHRIRRIAPDGTISTVAGNGTAGFAGDGGPAGEALLSRPVDLHFTGNQLWVLDAGNGRVRRIDLAGGTVGAITTIAGGGTSDDLGVPALQARLDDPVAISQADDGLLAIAEAGRARIRKLSALGVMLAYGGTGSADDAAFVPQRPLSGTVLGQIVSMERPRDSWASQKLYIANAQGRVLGVDASRIVNSYWGHGFGRDGTPENARLVAPTAMATSIAAEAWMDRRTFVVAGHRLLRLGYNGLVQLMVGDGQPATGNDGGTVKRLGDVTAIAVSETDHAYLAEASTNRIRHSHWTMYETMDTYAGNGLSGNSGDGGHAILASFIAPAGLARAVDGTLYVSSGQRIRRIGPDQVVDTFAGSDAADFAGDGGAAINARFRTPGALVLGPDGSLYVNDRGNRRIRRIGPDGIVSTVAGDGRTGLDGIDGPATAAAIGIVRALAIDWQGRLVFTVAQNRVLMVDGDGVLRAYAGTGSLGYSGDGGPAAEARLSAPVGLAVQDDDSILFADSGNDRVRRLRPKAPDGVRVPDAPPAPVAVAGFGKAKLQLTASAFDGGQPISEYEVRATPAGGVDAAAGTTALAREITGLVNEVPVTFAVRAHNMAGASPWSPESAPVTPSETTLPVLSFDPVSIVEGAFNSYGSAKTTARLDRPTDEEVRFSVIPVDGGDADSWDRVSLSSEVVIPVGQTVADVWVSTGGDDDFEGDERFYFRAQLLTGARAGADGEGVIVNDDAPPPMALRDDRMTVLENSETVYLHYRENDLYNDIEGQQITIVVPPEHGQAEVVQLELPSWEYRERIAYTPPPDWSGEDRLEYQYCYNGEYCRRAEVTFLVRPHGWLWSDGTWGTGFMDAAMQDLRPMPSARFRMTPMVEPRATVTHELEGQPGMGIDAYDPFLAAPVTRGINVWTIPAPADGQPKTWRIVGRLTQQGFDTHLYLGVDSNGDGLPSRDEKRCGWAMNGITPCEMELQQAPGQVLRYWTMVHLASPYSVASTAAVQIHEVPMHAAGDVNGVTTGPGSVTGGEAFAMRFSWRDPVPTEATRIGFARVQATPDAPAALVPVGISRTFYSNSARALVNGKPMRLRSNAQGSGEVFIDVPPGATRLTISSRDSTGDVDFVLARMGAWDNTTAAIAPPDMAFVPPVSNTTSGDETIVLQAPTLTEGRWYVIANRKDPEAVVDFTLTATVAGVQAPQRAGSYYNPGRPGHGLFLYPAGGDWAGIWYTYLQDGSPTWYWLQGPKPGGNGIWNGRIYRAAWNGASTTLTEIGEATVTPGTADVPAFRYSYVIDGQTGSEPMFQLGEGCPQLAGRNVDISTHWFNPARAGTGYSVQMWPTYEFFAAFVYDGLGVPRFLGAERQGFGGQASEFPLYQTKGSCPLCWHNPSTYADIGVFERTVNADGTLRLRLDGVFAEGVPGAWSVDEIAQTLGGAGTTQGCAIVAKPAEPKAGGSVAPTWLQGEVRMPPRAGR